MNLNSVRWYPGQSQAITGKRIEITEELKQREKQKWESLVSLVLQDKARQQQDDQPDINQGK